MGYQLLPATHAFQPGSRIWILPSHHSSWWTRKVDWYLNWQIQRSEIRWPDHQSPLIVASLRNVPPDLVVVLPRTTEISSWSQLAQEVWLKLNQPPLRVFLPTADPRDELLAPWLEVSDPITMVCDIHERGHEWT